MRAFHALVISSFALVLVLTCFSPRLWLMRREMPGTFQWDRARTFLLQCQNPSSLCAEPAMQWRKLPPLVAHGLGLSGKQPLVLPWLGALAATFYVALTALRKFPDWRISAACTLLFASSSAVLVPLHWFGMNDAWAWLGLLVVAFSPSSWARGAALLLAPWVDERFLIALPLAVMVRCTLPAAPASLKREFSFAACGVLPYGVLRAISAVQGGDHGTFYFLNLISRDSHVWLPFAPLGWWMAWRAGWLPAGYGMRAHPWRLGAVTALTLVTGAVLAADLSRSAAMIAPLTLAGCFLYAQRAPDRAPRHLFGLAAINLLIPAAHVIYNKIDVINPLPVELLRLWRI